MLCGLAPAIYSLKISYSLSILDDSDLKVIIKEINEPHFELILQKLYYCIFTSKLSTCLKYLIDKFYPKDESFNQAYYIFTSGFDEELKKSKS